MINIGIIAGIISFSFYIFVIFKKKIPLFSSYGAFGLLNAIYWIFPALTVFDIYPDLFFNVYELSLNKNLVGTYLTTLSAAILVFSFIFYLEPKKTFLKTYSSSPVKLRGEIQPIGSLYFLFYIGFTIILIALGIKYPYGDVSNRPAMVHSLLSLGKVLLASLYLFGLVSRPRKIFIYLMISAFAVLTVIEGSRWYFISILIATASFVENNSRISLATMMFSGLLAGIFLSLVGLFRSGVEINNALLLLSPFYIEGDYSSYSTLQTINLVLENKIEFFTFFADYIVDPIIYQIPRPVFLASGVDKDVVGFLPFFIDYHQRFLTEEYAPVGGFHYLAQATSAVPFLGPILITYIYAKVCVYFERKKHARGLSELIYYSFIGGFAFVFVKTIFAQTIKYFFLLFAPGYFLYILRKKMTMPKRRLVQI